jgi:hypothetical protein
MAFLKVKLERSEISSEFFGNYRMIYSFDNRSLAIHGHDYLTIFAAFLIGL